MSEFLKKTSLVVALSAPIAAWSAVPLIPSTPQYSEPSQIVGTLNFLISQINTFITPQTMANFASPRNVLDNGQMQVQQRGTGTRTCGTTTIPSSAYAADRWGCNVNVTSGAGTLQVITSNLPAAPNPIFNAGMVFATPTAGNCDLTACIVTAGNTNTAGQVEQLTGAAGGTGVWEVSADF